MELVSRQQQVEGEIPIPINNNSSTNNYATNGHHGHMIHHHDPVPLLPAHNNNNNNNINIIASSSPVLSAAAVVNGQVEDDYNKKVTSVVVVRYRECLKNHAASMGGNATDGCGEFMPSGEEGTIEALNCSACHCHRNFHRKEVEGEEDQEEEHYYFHRLHHQGTTRKFLLPPPPPAGGGSNIVPSRSVPPHHHHHMIMPFNYNIPNSLPCESDEQEVGGAGTRRPTSQVVVKKRFRTKFTAEQKEKMLAFADKVGWKLQKQEDSVVQHFCQEIGVKRRVLKVWMHNNKHNLAKKTTTTFNLPLPPTTTTA